jgi:uncharacterized protein YneF (UPF0154 family)
MTSIEIILLILITVSMIVNVIIGFANLLALRKIEKMKKEVKEQNDTEK